MRKHQWIVVGVTALVLGAAGAACGSDTLSDDDLGSGGSAGSDGGVGNDSGGSPAPDETGGAHEGGVGGTAGAATCQPTLSDWTPSFVPLGPLYRDACTSLEITAVVSSCLDNQLATMCPPDESASPDGCRACLVSLSTDEEQDVFISFGVPPLIHTNREGCIAALSGDTSSTGCGATMQANHRCGVEACKSCADEASFRTCVLLAQQDSAACKQYADAVEPACADVLGSDAWNACTVGTRTEIGRRMAELFCGAPPSSGGAGGAGGEGGANAAGASGAPN